MGTSEYRTQWDPYSPKRATTRDVFGLYKQTAKKLEWIYRGSNSYHHRRWGAHIAKCENSKKRIRYCRVKFCPVCQWRRNLQWRARFIHGVLPVIDDRYLGAQYHLLTLTVKNCKAKHLKTTVDSMEEAWTRLTQLRAFWPIIGWARNLEVTHDRKYDCHPHFHCLLMTNPETHIAWDAIAELWEQIPRLWQQSLRVDYEPVIDIREVGPRAFAYLIKPMELPIYGKDKQLSASEKSMARKYILAVTDQLWRARRIAAGGLIKKYLSAYDIPRERSFLSNRTYDTVGDISFSDESLSPEEQRELIEGIVERLKKERGVSHEEAVAIIREAM